KLAKTQILSHFVCYIDEVHLKSGQNVRIFSLSNEFYLNAFIIWLIFNIKMFFSLNFNDYIRFFKDLIAENWKS
ncbi:hypothetical protein U2057_15355, partial [Listeria monocytogenes]|uniref:hypothetical protein n=1 Tax=Listeria monocytogenes TaxID=1639 RepID=UPI002FDBC9D9